MTKASLPVCQYHVLTTSKDVRNYFFEIFRVGRRAYFLIHDGFAREVLKLIPQHHQLNMGSNPRSTPTLLLPTSDCPRIFIDTIKDF